MSRRRAREPAPDRPLRAALYGRGSTRTQAETGFSLAEQEAEPRALADQQGWEATYYEDAGLSGDSLDSRPQMRAVLAAVEQGLVDIVAVVDESRLARDEFVGASIRHL